MTSEHLYLCRRCRQKFHQEHVWRTDQRFICLDCSRRYKKDQDQAGLQRLERAVGGVLNRLGRLRFRGQCVACGAGDGHLEGCPVLALSAALAPQRGQFSPTTARLQFRSSREST